MKQKVEALRTDTESVNFVLTETLEQDEADAEGDQDADWLRRWAAEASSDAAPQKISQL